MADTQDLGSCAERRGGSTPLVRTNARVVELADTSDLKSDTCNGYEGSSPSPSTIFDLVDQQEDMPEDFARIVDEHFWDLI